MEGGCPGQPGYPPRGVKTQPAFTCNSRNRDSEWTAWVISWAAAKHNKHNGRPRTLFFHHILASCTNTSLFSAWDSSITLISSDWLSFCPADNISKWQLRKYSLRAAMFSRFIAPRLAEIARLEPFTWQKATPPSRVPRASRQGCPG